MQLVKKISKEVLHFYTTKILSRWMVLIMDLVICILIFLLTISIIFSFYDIPINRLDLYLPLSLLEIFFSYAIGFLIVGSYKGMTRYTSSKDLIRLFFANLIGFTILSLLSVFAVEAFKTSLVPIDIAIIHFLTTTLFLFSIRLFTKSVYDTISMQDSGKKNVLIYGAGEFGIQIYRSFQFHKTNHVYVKYFTDDDSRRWNNSIDGHRVLSPEIAFSKSYILKSKIDTIVIAKREITAARKKEILAIALSANIELKIAPKENDWFENKIKFNQLEQIQIEDLLNRDEIIINKNLIGSTIKGKTILITGAAGSIGQEITKQCLSYEVAKVILLDQSENGLHDLLTELKLIFKKTINYNIEVASVRDKYRIRQIFKKHRPSVVFHAAAYKHVPIVENSPYEGIHVNIFGTKIVADSALEFGVERFIMISTDKAVNPTNVMGATKRVAELYTQSLNDFNKTVFISTRFGNVLNSNGSVIPLFKKQIEKGGPLTVTHREITRYFMTIPEACGLVLEAAAIGKAKQVLVFDMGKPVKIFEMAEQLIRLSGYEPHLDIQIEFTGLRPGEKLYEELLTSSEATLSKIHDRILVAKADGMSYKMINGFVSKLQSQINLDDPVLIVSILKEIVTEFISENSEFETIDKTSVRAI